MSFAIEPAVKVDAEHLTTPVLLPVVEVDGKKYFTLQKGDRRIKRVLLDTSKVEQQSSRPLTSTSIIDDIVEAGRKEFWSRVRGDGKIDKIKKLK